MKISVITPSFKQFDWLRLCAASIADQEYESVEHIVQDAGTGDEVARWAAGRTNLKLYVEQDNGMYDAINRGLQKSSGKICAYLNCDEQYLPGVLAEVAAYFDVHPKVEILFGDAILTDVSGMPLSYRRVVLPGRTHTRLVHLNTLSCSMFFRRSLIERGFYFDRKWKMIADAVWISQLLEEGVQMACFPFACSTFAFTGKNLSEGKAAKQESLRWRSERNSPPSWLRWPAILDLRFRKLWSGAYQRRQVTIEIYTHDSAGKRKTFKGRVSYDWPKLPIRSPL